LAKDQSETILAELNQLLGLIGGAERFDYNKLYQYATQVMGNAKKGGLHKANKRKDPTIAEIREIATRTIHGENKAEAEQIKKARVAYWAYLEANGLRHHVNKGSGFNWERERAGMERVNLSGKPAGGKGGAKAGGDAAAASAASPAQDKARLAAQGKANRIAAMTPEAYMQLYNQHAEAAEEPPISLEQARQFVTKAKSLSAQGKTARKRQPQRLGRPSSSGADLVGDLKSSPGVKLTEKIGEATDWVARQAVGDVTPSKRAVAEKWAASRYDIKAQLARGDLSVDEVYKMAVADGAANPEKKPYTTLSERMAKRATADQKKEAVQDAYRRRVPLEKWTAPSLFGTNEAGQGYLEWLRTQVRWDAREKHPVPQSPSPEAGKTRSYKPPTPSLGIDEKTKKYKRKKNSRGSQIGGGR
jgi:hypothetical protein